MRRYSQRHNLGTLAELNVTPLLDLAFVLLIIFMITTPLMERNVPVVLPTITPAQGAVGPAQQVAISITRDSVIELNGKAVSPDQLVSELAAMKQSQSNIAVTIRPHKDLSVQKLMDVMDAVKRAGITLVGVAANPESE